MDNLRAGFDGASISAMSELTRRQSLARSNCWHIYFGDVHVGTIARSVGNPNAELQ